MRKSISIAIVALSSSLFSLSAFSLEVKCLKNESQSNCMTRVVMEGHNPLMEKLHEIKAHPNNNMYGPFYDQYRLMTKDIRRQCLQMSGMESNICLYQGQQMQMQALNEELARLKGLAVTDPQAPAPKKEVNCNEFNAKLKYKECGRAAVSTSLF